MSATPSAVKLPSKRTRWTDKLLDKETSGPKERLVSVGGNLYLRLLPDNKYGERGVRGWFFIYTRDGVRVKMGMGPYPTVDLLEAQSKALAARKELAAGLDPSDELEIRSGSNKRSQMTFEKATREWYASTSGIKQWSSKTSSTYLRRLELHAIPTIGDRLIASLRHTDIEAVVAKRYVTSDEGHVHTTDTANKLRASIRRVMAFAVDRGYVEFNFMPHGKSDHIPPPSKVKHHAAFTNPRDLAVFLRLINGYRGSPVTKAALQLIPLIFQRPGQLRQMEWSQIDWKEKLWVVPPAILKMRHSARDGAESHLVPLAQQSIRILKALQDTTGDSKYVFPSSSTKSGGTVMSDGTINKAITSLGYDTQTEITGHGFRATARTLIPEYLGVPEVWIERHMAHKTKEIHGTAYDRTRHLKAGFLMSNAWADFLDDLMAGKPAAKNDPMLKAINALAGREAGFEKKSLAIDTNK